MRAAVPGPPRPGLTPRRAMAALVLIATLVLAALASLPAEMPRPGAGSAAVTAGIVDGMHHGDGFYALAAGSRAPGESAFAVPLPTLAVVAAALPWRALTAMLWLLVGAVVLAWQARLREITGPHAWVATAALLCGCVSVLRPGLAFAPELWAGLFLSLSLARWRPGDPVEAIGFATAAALLAPAAGVFLLLMAAYAWGEDRPREAMGWLFALAVFAAVFAAHIVAVPPALLDPDATVAGEGLDGLGFAVAAIGAATILSALPTALVAAFVALSIAGWAGRPAPVARRTSAMLLAVGAALALVPSADEGWALLVAPTALVGLVLVPRMLAALVRAALDRRRITVRRVVR